MELTKKITGEYLDEFKSNKVKKITQVAVTKNGIHASSESIEERAKNEPVFSIEVETGKVTDQKRSGRCWMFAALNLFRHKILKEYGIEGFELSQNHIFFWDKYEKANYFHENILKTADEPFDSRKVAFLLQTPQQDGGQWDMVVSLIEKYGVVPKYVMPETSASSNSIELNKYLNKKLRKDAKILRSLVSEGADEEKILETRKILMKEVYDILSVSLGTPPEKFDFVYKNKDKEYNFDRGLTPVEFYDKYIEVDLSEYVSIINAPTKDKPYNRSYTVEMLGNVVGTKGVKYLNLNMEDFKNLAIKQLESGESVWFGSDVGQSSNTISGLMSLDTYSVGDLFDVDFNTSKADRLDYGESLMTHAMVLTGVDIVDGKPTRWKVENSWGEKPGNKGYFVMTDSWMDEFTYQIVVKKEFLSNTQMENFESKPIMLAPWDPMGSLA